MKTWLLGFFGFTLLILLGLFSHHYLQQSSNRLCFQINRIDHSLVKQQWEPAKQRLAALSQQWRRTEPLWAVLIHHQEIDNIENALVRLHKAILSQDYPGSQMSSGELRHFLQHIPQREEFTLVNIL
jgi:hypothetical protein